MSLKNAAREIALVEKLKTRIAVGVEGGVRYVKIPASYRKLVSEDDFLALTTRMLGEIFDFCANSNTSNILVDFTEAYPEDTHAYFILKCEHDDGSGRIAIKTMLDSLPWRIRVFALFCPGSYQFSLWR